MFVTDGRTDRIRVDGGGGVGSIPGDVVGGQGEIAEVFVTCKTKVAAQIVTRGKTAEVVAIAEAAQTVVAFTEAAETVADVKAAEGNADGTAASYDSAAGLSAAPRRPPYQNPVRPGRRVRRRHDPAVRHVHDPVRLHGTTQRGRYAATHVRDAAGPGAQRERIAVRLRYRRRLRSRRRQPGRSAAEAAAATAEKDRRHGRERPGRR